MITNRAGGIFVARNEDLGRKGDDGDQRSAIRLITLFRPKNWCGI